MHENFCDIRLVVKKIFSNETEKEIMVLEL